MASRDIQDNISEQSRNASDLAYRVLFHILWQRWKSLADNRRGLADAELIEELEFLSSLHARIATMTGTTTVHCGRTSMTDPGAIPDELTKKFRVWLIDRDGGPHEAVGQYNTVAEVREHRWRHAGRHLIEVGGTFYTLSEFRRG